MTIDYAVQPRPEGLAQAFLIGREFVGSDHVALVLGDNIFYGQGFQPALMPAAEPDERRHGLRLSSSKTRSATAWSSSTRAATRSRSRKSRSSRSRTYAVTGLYFYDNQVLDIAAAFALGRAANWKSPTSTAHTCAAGNCACELLGRGFAWLDTGTHESLVQAAFHADDRRAPRPEDRLPGRSGLS